MTRNATTAQAQHHQDQRKQAVLLQRSMQLYEHAPGPSECRPRNGDSPPASRSRWSTPSTGVEFPSCACPAGRLRCGIGCKIQPSAQSHKVNHAYHRFVRRADRMSKSLVKGRGRARSHKKVHAQSKTNFGERVTTNRMSKRCWAAVRNEIVAGKSHGS